MGAIEKSFHRYVQDTVNFGNIEEPQESKEAYQNISKCLKPAGSASIGEENVKTILEQLDELIYIHQKQWFINGFRYARDLLISND